MTRELRQQLKKAVNLRSMFLPTKKIRMVLINLVENASKYGKPGGSIVASIYKTDEKHVLVKKRSATMVLASGRTSSKNI